MSTDEKKQLIEAITRRIGSPKQYMLDGETITMDSPDDLAKLINLLKQVDAAEDGRKVNGSPFKVSVCRNNSPCI